ncbi:MAG TPA: hypothetical protein LFV90_04660 [Rickettsia endosymbiont of Columbicola hoogstraali]|nr:hypothetical protein [Rickettsia endosymbiont of Columbicola hoogstraali]
MSTILHYKTGNVQTEKFGFGNYKDIFQEILHNEEHKENSHLVLPKKLNNFAEQLTYLLFIIEMQRNNTTLFTAPMFLELTIQNSKYLKKEGFFLCPQKLLFLKQGG